MHEIINTGTDGASVCFFDAAALPDDFELRVVEDARGLFDTLQGEGRLWWDSTDGDGQFTFHFYVDEDSPEEFQRYATQVKTIDRFLLPSGSLWCCGEEYAARDPLAGPGRDGCGLSSRPHLGRKFHLPPGEYSVTLRKLKWPDGSLEAQLSAAFGSRSYRLFKKLLWVSIGLFLCGLLAVIALVFSLSQKWSAWASAAGAILVGFMAVEALKRPIAKQRRRIVDKYPAYAVDLHQLGSTLSTA